MFNCRKRLFQLTACSIVGLASLAMADAQEPCEPFDAIEIFNHSEIPPYGSTCTTFQGQNSGQGVSCLWTFGYRSEDAKLKANSVWDALESCRPGEKLSNDQPVNHPDSYLLWTWSTEDATYRLSQKDKAALGATYVFLSFETR